MERALGTVYDASGNKLDGVTVTVKKGGTGTNASIYADDGITTKSNPFTNDSDGSWEFFVANGLYDVVFAKTGKTFTDDNSKTILMYDPRDDAGAVVLRDDFKSVFFSGSDMLSDGNRWVKAGGVVSVTGDSTYRNGWIDIIESGATAGSILLANSAGSIALLWVPTSDVLILEARLEKVGDAVAGTRRAGLGSANLTSGDPTNGIYFRQIDTGNVFLVCRSGGTESTEDLGFTLNNPRRLRATITTSSVRPFIENDSGVLVADTAITTNIPTAILGLSAAGGATASAAGLRADYLNVISGVRV